jgi:hypothetical protein
VLTEAVAKERIEMAQKVVRAALDKKLLSVGLEQTGVDEFLSVASALVAPLGVCVRKTSGTYWYEFYAVIGTEMAAGGVGGPVRKTLT